MKTSLFVMIIFLIIGQNRVEPSKLPKHEKIAKNQLILDAYHSTNPLKKHHENRMRDYLAKLGYELVKGNVLTHVRKAASRLIAKDCNAWEKRTGWDQNKTDETLSEIYRHMNPNEPNQEVTMHRILLAYNPEFCTLDQRIVRNIVHQWFLQRFKRLKGAIKIRSKEDKADLVYVYSQVRFGNGSIHDRIAEKWNKMHRVPEKFSKHALLKEAYKYFHNSTMFTAEEIEEAKKRYERVFGAESGGAFDSKVKERKKWTRRMRADLKYLTDTIRGKRFKGEKFTDLWRAMNPEYANFTSRQLLDLKNKLKSRNFTFTPEEEAEAESRFKAAIANFHQIHHNNTMPDNRGKAPLPVDSHGQELHQQSSDSMFHSFMLNEDHDLTDDDWKYFNMLMNDKTSSGPPTPRHQPLSYHYGSSSPNALHQVPLGMSHTSFGPSAYDPNTISPNYEHGSSSHSHYNLNALNPNNEHGNRSHLYYNPYTVNPNYVRGSSSHSYYNPKNEDGSSSHSHYNPHL